MHTHKHTHVENRHTRECSPVGMQKAPHTLANKGMHAQTHAHTHKRGRTHTPSRPHTDLCTKHRDADALTNANTRTLTPKRTTTRTHTHTHSQTHTNTHAHARARTHSCRETCRTCRTYVRACAARVCARACVCVRELFAGVCVFARAFVCAVISITLERARDLARARVRVDPGVPESTPPTDSVPLSTPEYP